MDRRGNFEAHPILPLHVYLMHDAPDRQMGFLLLSSSQPCQANGNRRNVSYHPLRAQLVLVVPPPLLMFPWDRLRGMVSEAWGSEKSWD